MPRLPVLVCGLSLLFSALPAVDAVVAESPQPLPALTLAEALAEAEREATGPVIAAARLAQVRALQTQARALLLPTATLTGSYTSTWQSRPPYQGHSDDGLTGEAGIELRLFDGTAFPAMDAAKIKLAAQEHASRDLRRSTAYGVASAYLTVLTAERLRGVADRRLEVAEQLLAEAKARLRAGLAIASDVTRAEVEVAAGNLTVTQAVRAITIGRLALQEAIGGKEPGILSAPEIVAPEDRTPAELVAIALAKRDDLAASRLTSAAKKSEVEVIRRGNWPILGARAGVRDSETNAPTTIREDPNWYAGLTATWQLWDGGLRAGRIEEQEANRRELDANTKAAELAAKRQVAGGLVEIKTALIAVQQAETRSRSAAADAADSLARYRAGTATATELADAQLRSAQADADLEQRRIDVLSFRLILRQTIGEWPLTPAPALAAPLPAEKP